MALATLDAGGLLDSGSGDPRDASVDDATATWTADGALAPQLFPFIPRAADASVPFPCMPRGAWSAIFTEHAGGTCGSPTPGQNPTSVEIDFGDTIDTALTTPNCSAEPQLTPDTCQVTYNQFCTLGDSISERETGTWAMTSENEIAGILHTTRIDPSGAILCMSTLDVHILRD